MIGRRKFFSRAARHIEGLPDDFTPVSFLQSSGSQYIDTGRKLTQDSDITIDFRIVGEINRNAGIFGSREIMRLIAKEPVSPAPTTNVRGRSVLVLVI